MDNFEEVTGKIEDELRRLKVGANKLNLAMMLLEEVFQYLLTNSNPPGGKESKARIAVRHSWSEVCLELIMEGDECSPVIFQPEKLRPEPADAIDREAIDRDAVEAQASALLSFFAVVMLMALAKPPVAASGIVCLNYTFDVMGIPDEAVAIIFGLEALMGMIAGGINAVSNIAVTFCVARLEDKDIYAG